MSSSPFMLTSALLALCVAEAAVAADTTSTLTNGASGYDSAFFVQFAPRTALDIARRVPGFTLDLGNVDTRGFAGAAGNVVLNGSRPSSKSESLEVTLARIPADSVVRVEVGPGSIFGAEYAGKSQVLNVIISDQRGLDGTITASARRNYRGTITPNLTGSTMIKRGASTFNISAGTQHSYNVDHGTDTLTNLDTGEIFEVRRKTNEYDERNPYISASWALEHASDRAVRLNARWSPGKFDLEQWNRVSPAGEPERDDSLIQDYDRPVYEVGGDVTRPLAGGAVKLVALATRSKRDNFDAYLERGGLLDDGAELVGGFEQSQKAKLSETIGRLNWTRQDLAGFSFEAGGEAVLNTLDSTVDLALIDAAGGRTPIDLPIDSARVKEKRGEAFVNLGRALTPTLRADGGLTFEYSHLTVSGDASADRKLKFFKPNLAFDWKPRDGWHGRLSIRRTVAQLNFYDFISAAELANDRVSAGNENLVPQRSWEFRLSADRTILGSGLIKLDLGHDIISLFQDRVLVFDDEGNGYDAPGNIGTGRRSFAELNIDAPLGMVWSGLRAKLRGMVQRTRVEDPISGKMREFSDYFPSFEWSIDLRRDINRWSYGMNVQHRDEFTFFRTDEFDINSNSGPYGTAFVEFRPDSRWAVTLDVDNALNTGAVRERLLFYPNRAEPDFRVREVRLRNRHLNFGLTVKRSFGGTAEG